MGAKVKKQAIQRYPIEQWGKGMAVSTRESKKITAAEN